MYIRTAAIADIPLIRELTMQVWPQTYTPIIGEEQVNYMLNSFYHPDALKQQMEDSGHTFLIGEFESKPVAFASYGAIAPGIFKLHKLYIVTGLQGKGIGRSMLDHIVGDLQLQKATSLRLNVNRYNTNARAFYDKMGFKHFATEDIDIGNGYFMNDYVLDLPVTLAAT